MGDLDIITCVFVVVDDFVKQLGEDTKPGPTGKLSLSEVLTLAILHPLLKPFVNLKRYYKWLGTNYRQCFPALVEYSRFTRLLKHYGQLLESLQRRHGNTKSFGLIADGTTVPVMKVVRGPYAKSFRDARKVYSASKKQWDWGFLLELVIDQAGTIAFFSLGKAAEIRQLTNILEDLKDRWVLGDRGSQGKKIHEKLWKDKQIRIKLTGGKERQWIENVIGVLKDKLGLDRIRVRKTYSFTIRVTAILCAYNLALNLNLPI